MNGYRRIGGTAAIAVTILAASLGAHHSFAMYNMKAVRVFTGVVTRVDPAANHLQMFFAPMNQERKNVERDAKGEPIVWNVEMAGAGQMAKQGVSVNTFPPGTVFSVGLHPLRSGARAGARIGRAVQVPRQDAARARKALRFGNGTYGHRQGTAGGADEIAGGPSFGTHALGPVGGNQGLPVMGTNRTGSVLSVSIPVAVRRRMRSSCVTVPTGIAIKPPIFSCSTSAGGHFVGRRRDHDAVVGRVLGPAQVAVAGAHVRCCGSRGRSASRAPGPPAARRSRSCRPACASSAEHRRLIAGTRADLEHPMVRLNVERLGHERDDVGLRDRLPEADRQGRIVVGPRAQ